MFIIFNGIDPHLWKGMQVFVGEPSLWAACSSSEEYYH